MYRLKQEECESRRAGEAKESSCGEHAGTQKEPTTIPQRKEWGDFGAFSGLNNCWNAALDADPR
jgi:hypothetical protein